MSLILYKVLHKFENLFKNGDIGGRVTGIRFKSRLKIISGGQTGVDRAALDAAIASGLRHGGWCPLGRIAEDGTIPSVYRLKETPLSGYRQRTEWNVRDSHGTLILSHLPLSGGTAYTEICALEMKKPAHIADPDKQSAAETAAEWLRANSIRILNVAGPRESSDPGIHDKTFRFLAELFKILSAQKRKNKRGF